MIKLYTNWFIQVEWLNYIFIDSYKLNDWTKQFCDWANDLDKNTVCDYYYEFLVVVYTTTKNSYYKVWDNARGGQVYIYLTPPCIVSYFIIIPLQ